MTHNHDHCHHELKFCEQCDAVYCTKCKKEWGQHAPVQVIQQPPYWHYTPWIGAGAYPYNGTIGVSFSTNTTNAVPPLTSNALMLSGGGLS